MFLDFIPVAFNLHDLIEDSLDFLYITVGAEMLELENCL